MGGVPTDACNDPDFPALSPEIALGDGFSGQNGGLPLKNAAPISQTGDPAARGGRFSGQAGLFARVRGSGVVR